MATNHGHQTQVHRDHITIDLGTSRYWLSIVSERASYYSTDEIALVFYTPPSSLLSDGTTACIPLRRWWDTKIPYYDDDLVLFYDNPERYGFASQADLLARAISLAQQYARSAWSSYAVTEVE